MNAQTPRHPMIVADLLPSKKLRALTFKQWKKMGGCGIGGREEGNAAKALGLHAANLDHLTIGEITDAWLPAGRTIADYARREFGAEYAVTVERIFGTNQVTYPE